MRVNPELGPAETASDPSTMLITDSPSSLMSRQIPVSTIPNLTHNSPNSQMIKPRHEKLRTVSAAETAHDPRSADTRARHALSLGPRCSCPTEVSPAGNLNIVQKGKLSPRGTGDSTGTVQAEGSGTEAQAGVSLALQGYVHAGT